MRVFRKSLAPKLVGILISALLVASILSVFAVREALVQKLQQVELRDQEQHLRVASFTIKSMGGPINERFGKLYAGSTLLNNDTSIVDAIQEQIGGYVTIFHKDKGISTNVLLEDGSRALGFTILGRESLYEAVMGRGETVWQPIGVLGVPHLAAYAPLISENGNRVGILFVGIRQDDFFATINEFVLVISVLLLVICALVSVFAYRLIKRFTQPIHNLREIMRLFSNPGVNAQAIEIPYQDREDEIGVFARQLVEMQRAYETNEQLTRATAIQETEARLQEARADIEKSKSEALAKALKELEEAQTALEQQRSNS